MLEDSPYAPVELGQPALDSVDLLHVVLQRAIVHLPIGVSMSVSLGISQLDARRQGLSATSFASLAALVWLAETVVGRLSASARRICRKRSKNSSRSSAVSDAPVTAPTVLAATRGLCETLCVGHFVWDTLCVTAPGARLAAGRVQRPRRPSGAARRRRPRPGCAARRPAWSATETLGETLDVCASACVCVQVCVAFCV